MALWIAMAVLAAAASLPVLVALGRPHAGRGSAHRPALAVYRDQLDEVGRDVARGIIDESEADGARTEIARRLIHAGDEGPPDSPAPNRRTTPLAAIAIAAAPLAALGFYLAIGSPEMPDQPLVSRLSAPTSDQDVATIIARVEAHLAANPEDGTGWEAIAPVYLRFGRYDEAVSAFSNAIRILGSTAGREATLGEAIVGVNQGMVTKEARAAFERARALAPDDPRPRFFLALALGQEGRRADAIGAWQALLDGAPQGAPWVAAARAELAALTSLDGPGQPGPAAQDMEAVAALPTDERLATIDDMVASLAVRLETDQGDAEGWARLIRSYMVLDRPADARDALARARIALAEDVAKLALVDDAARAVGLEP